MPKGGARPGAGRPKGRPNKATTAREQEIKASGLTPLEYMLKVLRDEDMPDGRRDWAAEKAAPYVHPKYGSIEHTGEGGGPLKVILSGPDTEL